MNESAPHGSKEIVEGRWQPEAIPEQRLKALVPYTGASSVEELRALLDGLAVVLSRLSFRERRHKFVARRGGPTKTEYVLYAGGTIVGKDFAKVESTLHTLGIRTGSVDTLDREFVVSDEVSKVRLEILGLVLGYDPESDMRDMKGDNWNVAIEMMMERAALEETLDDIPLVERSHRTFPLKGSTQLQKLHPALRAHFMDQMQIEVPEEDPVELDVLIDNTAERFEQGSLSLDQAFAEWGVENEEEMEDVVRTTVPAGKPLGERLEPARGKFLWKSGKLFKRDSKGGATEIAPQELKELYARARPAAELLWDADALSRRASTLEDNSGEGDLGHRLNLEARAKRTAADALPESLEAIKSIVEIHSGFVFRRVMRFLKRRDVRAASSYGPHDLMQEGLLGLYQAIAKYELDGAASFVGYARYRIDGMMLAYAVKHRSFTQLPVSLQAELHKLYDIDVKSEEVPTHGGEHAMSPDVRADRRLELAKRIFGDKFDISRFLDKKRRETHQESHSYLVPLSDIDDSDPSEVDMLGNDLVAESVERELEIVDTKHYLSMLFLQVLTPREETVVRARFGLGGMNEMIGDKTLDESAERIGSMHSDNPVTRERIRQIEGKALRKLKGALYRRFGRYKYRGDGNIEKYIDLAAVARVFDVGDFRG